MSGITKFDPTRWDPFKQMEEMTERMSKMFATLPARIEAGREALLFADWSPTVDVIEDDQEFLIKAEIPEVDKKAVRVSLQDNVLMIEGERKQEKEEKGKKFHRVERSYGTFVRSFTLPKEVAEDKLTAEFKDGMLLVHLPKTEKAKPKSIEVNIS